MENSYVEQCKKWNTGGERRYVQDPEKLETVKINYMTLYEYFEFDWSKRQLTPFDIESN